METTPLKQTLETLLFITDRPLSLAELGKLPKTADVQALSDAVAEIRGELEARGSALQVMEVAHGFQLATRPEHAACVRRLFEDRMTMRLSTPALETLSIIAYRQPQTRAEVEAIRGVEVIAALETLIEKALVRVVGRKETTGRPLMYGTTPEFLRHFGLKSLEELPALETLSPSPSPEPPAPVTLSAVPSGEHAVEESVPTSEAPASETPSSGS